MTSVLNKQPATPAAPWSVMPGWGVVADLTPPELTELRRLGSLRKIVAIGLSALLVALVAGYVLATLRASSAQHDLDATHRAGDRLTSETDRYSAVTRLQSNTAVVDAQIAGLMATDVDVAGLMTAVTRALPGSMSITSMNVALTSGTVGAAPSVPAAGAGAATVIGTVTMSGQSQHLGDLADYAAALLPMRGVTAVLPSSNVIGTAGTATWSLSFSLTDALRTHRYTATSTGGH